MEVSFVRLFLLMTLVQTSLAIRCFICQSTSNTDCLDPSRSYKLQLTQCDNNIIQKSSEELAHGFTKIGLPHHQARDLLATPMRHTYPHMSCQKISYYVGDQHIVIRGCHSGDWSAESRTICRVLEDQTRIIPGTYVDYCDTCDRDACNGARRSLRTTPFVMLMSILVPALFALILKN